VLLLCLEKERSKKMKVEIMYYDKKFNNKPTGYEVADVQKNLKKTTIEISELATALSQGATFKPALLNGTKSADWIQQQLFALDFDHDTTIDEQINKCAELKIYPCFGYTSFSHSEQEHHFRLVFCTDTVITDVETRNKLQNTLISIFNKSDNVTKDCTRIFFGGKSLICDSYNKRINAQQIIKKYYKALPLLKCDKSIEPKSCKKKLDLYSNTESNENMALKFEAIRALNVDVMKELLKGVPNKEDILPSSIRYPFKQTSFENEKDLYKYINSIDLSEYLGIDGYVNCILPEHEDDSPSAHIYTTDDGTQVYKCFGCNKCYTIIGITEKLAQCKKSQAIEFIKSVYNLKLEKSDWVKQQQQMLIDNANYLDSEEFDLQFPTLSKLIRTRKVHIQKMLLHFTQYVNDNMQNMERPIFFDSYKNLLSVCGIRQDSRKILSQSLTLFALLNMIEKLPVESIPEKELTKAKHIAAKYGFKKITNFYSFPEYGVLQFENSEEIAKTLKANNITLKGLSREYILRTFGTELANKCYPQYIHENSLGTTEKSDNATIKLSVKALETIEAQGYILEKDIKQKGLTEIQWKKSIQEILNTYGLIKIKASKDNKEKYNIADDISYQSSIIVKAI